MQLPAFRIRYVLPGHGATISFFSRGLGRGNAVSKNENVRGSNMNRKCLYRECLHAFDPGLVEPGERKRLPYCVEPKVRQCFRDENGLNMRCKESIKCMHVCFERLSSMAFYGCCHTNLYADNLQ